MSEAKSTTDQLNRPLRDLRISVTDRCNFRCVYCMPKHMFSRGHKFLDRSELLSYEEITRVARCFVDLGVKKLRVTGGEPLIRAHLEKLIFQLASISGVEDISLTTNASRLTRTKAIALKDAGLNRITISLDALDDQTFTAINDVEYPVRKVLEGVELAEAAGLGPIKINVVIQRGVNEHSIVPMAEQFRGTDHIVRFIEYMDVGHTNGWRLDDVLPVGDIVAEINSIYPLVPINSNYNGEVAKRWRYVDGSGEIGVISSVTQPFCRDCSRARLSAKGELFTCLFATHGHDIRAKFREENVTDQEFRRFLGELWGRRNDRYSEIRSDNTVRLPKVEMSYIGG